MARKLVPQRVEEVKQSIIQASMELIIKNGFSQFALKSVAEKLGITKAAIYWYFPAKDDLIKELSRSVRDQQLGYARKISSCSLSSGEKLNAILNRFNNSEAELTCILPIKIFLECYSEKNEIKHLIQESYIEFTNIIEDILKEGVKTGEFRLYNSAEATARFLVGAIDGVLLHALITEDKQYLQSNDFIKRTLEILINKSGGESFNE